MGVPVALQHTLLYPGFCCRFAKIVYPLAPASSCLARSPTIAWYAENDAATAGTRLDLVPTYEEAALYDGLIGKGGLVLGCLSTHLLELLRMLAPASWVMT